MKEKNEVRKYNVRLVSLIIGVIIFLTIALTCYVGYKKFIGKQYINYYETSNLDYSVCFRQPNDFYEEECLPKTINNYVSKYIDYINVNFNYKLNLSEQLDTSYKYGIIGELTIYDRNNYSNIMNRKNYTFVEEKDYSASDIDEFEIRELIKLDYSEFDRFVTSFKNNANVQVGANLKIILSIKSLNEHSKVSEPIPVNNDIVINIPLGEQTIQINTDYKPSNQSLNIEIGTNQTIVNDILKIMSFITGLIGITLLIMTIISSDRKYKEKPIYERFIKELKNDFDADITDLKSLIDTEKEDSYSYLDVTSFKELYELIKTSVDKKIFWNEKKYKGNSGNRIAWFFVFMSDTKVARFIVDENILTKEYAKDKNIINKYRG